MVVKTFRGLLADGGQDQINLHTNDGKTGYKIVKFQIMPNEPGEAQHESTVKIFTDNQDSINNTIDFNDPALLAASIWQAGNEHGGQDALWIPITTIFDQEMFNQDIFVTHSETDGTNPINYYIELEVIPLATDEAMVATLKDIRASA